MKSRRVNISRIVKIAGVLIFFNILTASGQSNNNQPVPGLRLEVLYFHAPNRCPSCIATEDRTRQTINTYFKSKVKDGQILFKSLDLKAKENESLVLKYEIVFPTLLILKKSGNKEIKTDFSTIAFQYAYADPAKYESLLIAELNKNLK